jgi:hypothetical protein
MFWPGLRPWPSARDEEAEQNSVVLVTALGSELIEARILERRPFVEA